jgi:hypothetical protein
MRGVVDDHATGRLIPQYRDFKLGINKRGARPVCQDWPTYRKLLLQQLQTADRQPEDDGKGRLAGRADRTARREPAEQLFPFLWATLRDPLREVMTP